MVEIVSRLDQTNGWLRLQYIYSHVYEPLDETTEIGKEQGAKSNFTTKPFKVAEILAEIL